MYRLWYNISMKSRYLSQEELNQILVNIPTQHRLIYKIAYETGMRIGDVLKIRKSDIKCEKNAYFLQFIAEKTQKRGKAPLSDSTADELMRRRAGRRNFIFPSDRARSGHLTRQYAWKMFKDAATAAGIDISGVSPHALRKSFAADLLKKSSYSQVKKALQHSYDSVTNEYAFSDILSGKQPDAAITWREVDALTAIIAARIADKK